MTHLNIQQGLNVEVVTTLIIKKLYEAALSVPEPLEGELDAAYMSGNLLINKSYRALVEYLTNRFDDLHINVTGGYYIPFEDSAVLNVLLANNIGSDGIGITEAEAANATLTAAMFLNNTNITSFDAFKYFTKANTNPPIDLFRGCTNLSSINLLNASIISQSEFCESGITTVNAPNLISLGTSGFRACPKITKVKCLGKILSIPNGCFLKHPSTISLNLSEVYLPYECTSIGDSAFNGCASLTTIKQYTQSVDNWVEGQTPTYTGIDRITNFGLGCFSGCTLLFLTTSEIANAVTIGNDVFWQANISGVLNLPNLVLMGSSAFRLTGITSVTSLGSITKIDNDTFRYCSNLSSVVLPTTCTTIGNAVFQDTSLSSINLSNVTTIGSNAFLNCQLLTSIDLSNIRSVGGEAFRDCKGLTSISFIGSTITTIPNGLFKTCTNLTSVQLPNTITSIGAHAFSGDSSLSSINIPSSCTSIGKEAFNGCSSITSLDLTNITSFLTKSFNGVGCTKLSFPNLTSIPNLAFYYCPAPLTTVEFGSSLQSIGTEPFWGSLIKNIIFHSTTVPSYTDPYNRNFLYDMTGVTIYVPDASLNDYKTTGLWANMANNIKGLSELPS